MRLPTPQLRPGLVLLRRSRDQVQIGLRRPEVLVADSRQAARTFDESTGQLVRASDAEVITHLAARSLLLEPEAARVLRPPVGDATSRRDARDRAASVLRHGTGALRARDQRARPVPVLIHGASGRDLAEEVSQLLRAAGGGGLVETDVADAAPPGPVLVVADGEPPRAWSDALVRHDVAHLYLRVVESTVLLGPWVQPGTTACLRCDDIHRCAVDPVWPLLVQQASLMTSRARTDDVATPAESLAVAAAAAGAARDLVRHAEGLVPATWSSETRWGPPSRFEDPATDDGELATRSLRRHGACGCIAWQTLAG